MGPPIAICYFDFRSRPKCVSRYRSDSRHGQQRQEDTSDRWGDVQNTADIDPQILVEPYEARQKARIFAAVSQVDTTPQ